MASNETLDSWEDFQEFEAPGRKVPSKKKSINSNNLEDVDPSLAPHSMVVTEETHRTQYKPQIRILKREPPSTASEGRRNGSHQSGPTSLDGFSHPTADKSSNDSSKPKKTLAQREAEYAEARRRILGPSYNPEEQGQQEQQQLLQQQEQQKLSASIHLPPHPPSLVPPFPPPSNVPSLVQLVPPYPPPFPPPQINPNNVHSPVNNVHPLVNNVHHQSPNNGHPSPNNFHPSHPNHPTNSNHPINHTHVNQPDSECAPRRLAQRMENLKVTSTSGVIVVRQPNGPDPNGTKGFATSNAVSNARTNARR